MSLRAIGLPSLLGFLSCALWPSPGTALASAADGSWGPQVFFNADDTYFDTNGNTETFEGDVVAIAAGTLIAADRIVLNRVAQTLTATGHVLVLNASQVFAGEVMTHHMTSGEFTLTAARMVANYPTASQNVIAKTLGFSFQDLAFEASRQEQLQALASQKEELRQSYRTKLSAPASERAALVEQYTVLLEKERLIANQLPAEFSRLPADKKEAFAKRREYWQKSQADAIGYSFAAVGYFAIEGDQIKRLDANEFQANNAFMTPCLCTADEKPAWGFHASTIKAKAEGYADLTNPVLTVKGIPLLYLPYLKIPIKAKRQSGFLIPNVTYTSSNGNIFSQPVYFALNERSDATITSDLIEKRGLRLGVEYRIQAKQYSGWELSAEAIRDRRWLLEKGQREDLITTYGQGLQKARAAVERGDPPSVGLSPDEPAWWTNQGLGSCLGSDGDAEVCQAYHVRNRLASPGTAWRGKLGWRGQTILAPRLNVVSSGTVLSDHRYLDDLYVPNFSSPSTHSDPALFSEAAYRVHLDGQNFYAGLGANYGDHALAARRFDGYQLPLTLRLQSRLIALAPSWLPVPIYGQASYDHRRIDLRERPELDAMLPERVLLQSLDGGTWQRNQFTFLSPLVVDQVYQASHFTEFEQRFITTGPLYRNEHVRGEPVRDWQPSPHSLKNYLHTLRTGLRLSLPLEGYMALRPQTMPGEDIPTERQLQHRMNWEMTLSLRPYVARRGDYGQAYQQLGRDGTTGSLSPTVGAQRLTYFASDSQDYSDSDVVAEERLMVPHQKLIFKTSHDWLIEKRQWGLGLAKAKPLTAGEEGAAANNLRAQAERELFYSLDRPISSVDEMMDASGSEWYINRYVLRDVGREQPLHFDAEISYDYRKEQARRKQRELEVPGQVAVSPLPEPWSPLRSNLALRWSEWSLGIQSQYNLYQRMATELNFGLTPPTFYGTSLGFFYRIDKVTSPLAGGGFRTSQTRTRSFTLASEVIPRVVASLAYGMRTRDDQLPHQERMGRLSLRYLSPSDCWGIKFAYEKDYPIEAWNEGTYFLALVVKFLNYDRDIGNLASRLNKPRL